MPFSVVLAANTRRWAAMGGEPRAASPGSGRGYIFAWGGGLALSGGGFRATLFHLGSFGRLVADGQHNKEG